MRNEYNFQYLWAVSKKTRTGDIELDCTAGPGPVRLDREGVSEGSLASVVTLRILIDSLKLLYCSIVDNFVYLGRFI
jgi:hypothetical protein